MFDLEILSRIAKPANSWFKSLSKRKNQLNEREIEAIKAFYEAVNETRIYVNKLNKPDPSKNNNIFIGDKVEEEKLSRLWTTASYKIQNFSKDLAKRCLIKGDYWTNPDGWSDNDIIEKRIEIDRMFEDAQKLIGFD